MTTPQQNNPIAVGMLVSVLAGTVFYTFVQMRGDEAPPVTATPVAVEGAGGRPAGGPRAVVRGTHDPFYHPSLLKAPAPGPGEGPVMAPPTGAGPAVLPLPPAVALEAIAPQDAGAGRASGPPSTPSGGPAAGSDPAAPQQTADGLRVTAIVGAGRRSAVVEGTAAVPLVVEVGDRVAGMRVMAVNAREIVLRGPRGLSTVPLDSPGAGGDVPVPAAEEESHAVR